MADHTGIQWSDATWNPVAGCTHCSPGCDNCYAAVLTSTRLKNRPQYEGLAVDRRFTGQIRLLPERLDAPLRWRTPRRVFVNSMSDLFHPDVPSDFIRRIFEIMLTAGQHTYQVLTKRPQRMAELVGLNLSDLVTVAPHIWLGTSIEHNRFTFRADHLRATPAAVRFLSCEPLIGPLISLDLTGIDWVIVGGESGHSARRMDPNWALQLRRRCADADVPFFFKQAGSVLAREWGMTDRHGHTLDQVPVDELRAREWPVTVRASA